MSNKAKSIANRLFRCFISSNRCTIMFLMVLPCSDDKVLFKWKIPSLYSHLLVKGTINGVNRLPFSTFLMADKEMRLSGTTPWHDTAASAHWPPSSLLWAPGTLGLHGDDRARWVCLDLQGWVPFPRAQFLKSHIRVRWRHHDRARPATLLGHSSPHERAWFKACTLGAEMWSVMVSSFYTWEATVQWKNSRYMRFMCVDKKNVSEQRKREANHSKHPEDRTQDREGRSAFTHLHLLPTFKIALFLLSKQFLWKLQHTLLC